MAVIDSLEVDIQSKSESVNKTLDDLVRKLGLVAEGIDAIGKNSGLADFAKKAKEATQGLSGISNAAKNFSAGIEPQIQKVSKSISDVAKEFQEKFKNIPVKIDFSKPESELVKFQKQAQTAENALARIMASSTADKQIAGIERWSISLAQANNAIKQIQGKLEEETKLNIGVDTKALESTEDLIERMKSHIQQMLAGKVIENPINIPDLSEEQFEIFKELEAQAISASRSIGDKCQEIEESVRTATQSAERPIEVKTNGIEETEQKISNLSSQLRNMGDLLKRTVTFTEIRNIDNWHQLADGVKNFVKNAQLAAGIKVHTKDYKILQGDIERVETELDKLYQKNKDMDAEGVAPGSKEWQKLIEQIATAESRLDSYIAKRNEMQSSGADVEFTGGLANQSALKNMGAVAGEALSSLRQRLSEIPGAVSQVVGNIPIIGRVAKEAAFLGQSAFNGFKFALSSIPKVASVAASAISKVASMVAKLVSGVKGAISKLSKMAKSFIGLKGASKGMNTSLGGGLKTILKYGLGIRSLYTLINKLRTAMKEGFKNLAQYSTETNTSISMLKSSLGALQNSLAVAFAPILNVIAPALSAFIDMLTKAFNTVGQFFAALTGKTLAVQAKKTFTDYADSVSEAGSATKDAGKDVQKGLRAFDELNVIYTNNKEESSGGGGGGGVSPADMFETVPIDNGISDFAQKIKDAWANADFTEIGAILGTKLKNALDSIDWEPIKETAAKIGKSIATLINGFVEVDGLADSIGRTIGEAINTGITGINAFLDNTHWDSVGIFIGEGLNGIVNTVDWEGLGHLFAAKWNAIFEVLGNLATTFDWTNFGLQLATSVNTFVTDFDWAANGAHFGELIKGLLDTIISFLEETDWQALGNGIADFIGGIDWTGIIERLAEGIGAALGGLAALLWGLIEDAWNSVVQWWQDTAFEDGQFTITGLLNGIWEGIKNIGTWIYEHIFKPFIDGFKKAFGIASPSKVMEEQGGFIMQGLLGGISSLVQSVIDIFNKIKEKIVEVWGAIKTKTSEVWNGIKTFVSGLWTGLKTNVSNVFGSIKTTITNIWNGIKTVTTNVWNGIKNAVKTPINAIIGFINGMVSGVVSGMNGMINAMNKLSFDVPDWVPAIGGKTFGFNIPNITAPQIPYLAKGAVFKGGNPFLAVVNDQRRGQTNIEAPLQTIKDALREELQAFTVNFNGIMPKAAMPNYQIAPAPSLAGAYGNYRYDMGEYATSHSNNNSEIIGMVETIVNRAMYNAVASALNNNQTMRNMLDEVKKGHTIEMDGRTVANTVRKEANDYFRRTGRAWINF